MKEMEAKNEYMQELITTATPSPKKKPQEKTAKETSKGIEQDAKEPAQGKRQERHEGAAGA